LEQLLLALEKTAGDGSIGNAGMLRRREDVNGNMVVGLTDARGKDGIEFIEGRRTNARSSARITSVSGLGGSADTDESGKAVLRSDAAVEEISTMLSRLTSNQVTSVDEYTLADLASLFTGAQTDQGKLNSFIQAIKAKAVSGDAMGMVGKQLVSIAKKDGSYEKMDEEKKNSLDELAAMTSRTIRSSSASADPSAEAASSASVVSSDSVPAASSPPPPAVASTTTSASGAPAIVPTPTPTPTPTHTSAPTPEEQGVYVGPENSEEDIINNNNAIYGILQREGDMDADNITEELLDRIRIQIDNTALERDIDGPDYNPYSDKKNVQDALPVAKQQIKEREELAEKTSMVSELQNIASIFEAQKTDGDSDATLTEILGVLKDEGGETKKAGAIDLSQLQTAMSKALAKQTQELSTALKSGGMNEDVEQADLLRIVRAMNAQHASGETGEESKDAPATLYDKLVVQEIKNLKSVLVRKTGSAVHTDSIQAVRKSLPTDDTQRKQALENEDELVKKYTEAEDKRTRRS